MKNLLRTSKNLLLLLCAFLALPLQAAEFDYRLHARRVAENVYSFIGRTEDFTPANGGNIVNTAFIVGREGVIVIDTGPSLRYGQQMLEAIARITDKPVALVINTHHHPDHMLGNQAFPGNLLAALPGTTKGIAGDGNAFAENLYRMTGDWMKGTEVVVPTQPLAAGRRVVAGRSLRLIALDGHTGSDLAVYDETSGVLFTGDLAFNGRAPTTPHADIRHWLTALDALEALTREPGFSTLVPGHGETTHDASPIRQTRAWILWLSETLRSAAQLGLDMNEVLARPLPPEFASMPMAANEYRRSVIHLFPALEREALGEAR